MIVDNHELIRRGLAALVNAESDMVACAEAACTTSALEAVARFEPDVVIVDVSPSRGAGLEIIQGIRKLSTKIRIVALAMSERPELAEQVRDAGAAALVVKTDVAPRVLEAIRRARVERETRHPERTAAKRPALRPSRRGLDAVEREIVEMIGRGVPTRAIAVRLRMSVPMVEARRRRIRRKLNLPTATQLVQFCVRWVERHASLPAES